jgi:FkbM family methyltransferase
MLLNLTHLIRKHGLKIKGVIHVGAHFGEEDKEYLQHGIYLRHYFEPCAKAFKVLKHNIHSSGRHEQAYLYECALGSEMSTEVLMNVESHNKGQSNSILKPKTHLRHYPLIQFNDTEVVSMITLDSVGINNCNLLNMDVQGYELEVLKGGVHTLQHIDYVYTEVNTYEVYEGCAKLHELDEFLKDFDRIEMQLTGQGWGDALYVRKQKKPGNKVTVPLEFRPHHPMQYPSDNKLIFEEWFYQQPLLNVERSYLPVFWTSYYCKNGYHHNKRAIAKLQQFLDRLDKTKRYYTIVQYDDGILNNLDGLDIKVLAMSGSRIDYPLPLICQPHQFLMNLDKDIKVSYIGANNHPIREKIIRLYKDKPDHYISDKPHSLLEFCRVLARSRYVLCPRGYGKTSFRIMEALQYGAVPIYISDDFVYPHHAYHEYGLSVKPDHLEDGTIEAITNNHETKEYLIGGMLTPLEAFERYFTYQANYDLIYKYLLSC